MTAEGYDPRELILFAVGLVIAAVITLTVIAVLGEAAQAGLRRWRRRRRR